MIDNLKIKAEELMSQISYNQMRLLSFRSIYNFLIYFDNLPNKDKANVEKNLSEYFKNIEELNYFIDKETSNSLGFKYILKIGPIYKISLNFKHYMTYQFALFWGIICDFVLYILGMLQKIDYIPISTIILLINYGYIELFYASKNKTYGLRY